MDKWYSVTTQTFQENKGGGLLKEYPKVLVLYEICSLIG
jgi:hypothetical protein